MLSCIQSSCAYLINQLPINNQVVKDARYLQPGLQQKKASVNAFSRLSLTLGQALGNEAIQHYFSPNIKTKYDLCDKVKQEYAIYQLEKIPESFVKNPEVFTKPRNFNQNSYWAQAYGLVDVEMLTKESNYKRCDLYWLEVIFYYFLDIHGLKHLNYVQTSKLCKIECLRYYIIPVPLNYFFRQEISKHF